MIKLVIVGFNEYLGRDERPNEHPSFQYFVKTLADAPLVGDYVGMKVWSKERGYVNRLVRVRARRIEPDPPHDRYHEDTEMSYYVTLMVEKDASASDFRG